MKKKAPVKRIKTLSFEAGIVKILGEMSDQIRHIHERLNYVSACCDSWHTEMNDTAARHVRFAQEAALKTLKTQKRRPRKRRA